MTFDELLKEGVTRLQAAGVPDAVYDAHALMEAAGGPDRTHFPLVRGEEVSDGVIFMFDAYVGVRANRIPLQHILGEAWFRGLSFDVDEDVLIPRHDTETLVEAVLREAKTFPAAPSVLDLCTGSGCVAVCLAAEGDFASVTAADISHEAVNIARENAAKNGVEEKILFAEGDLFRAKTKSEKSLSRRSYDIICANPPYVPTAEIEELEPEVRDHDPLLALDGGADGLDFYRRLAKEAGAHLNDGGEILLEIGCEQGEAVMKIFAEAGWRDGRVEKDLAGRDRVFSARKP
ncbi:MAG: peptide chain release factor N(5)-glutamine methyltransferase [Lachnospiraceae bacterium]|nr:peptide chain release factor N(5)-glutamine methyltransferase [Lachnospiraceae bacterium]